MRKFSTILLFFMLMLFVSACRAQENLGDTYHFETDSQPYMFADLWGYSFAEGPDGYYYFSGGKMRFIDNKSMKDGLLCAKPNCTHEDETCNALIGIPTENLHYYDGYLYAIVLQYDPRQMRSFFELQRISLDGGSRKKIADITWNEEKCEGTPVFHVVHRGKCYCVIQQNSGENGSDILLEIDLKTGKIKELAQMKGIQSLKAMGNHLYWKRHEKDISICQYDIASGELAVWENGRLLYSCKDRLLLATYDLQNKEYKLSWKDRAGNDLGATSFQLKLGKNAFQADERYFYRYPYAGTDRTIDVYDVETLEQITVLEIPEEMSASIRCVVCPGEILILYTTDKATIFYCSVADIGTPNFQWHQVEKVN